MKIIHILHHSQPNYNSDIKFWKEDWHSRVATHTLEITDKYEIECWRPEKKVERVIVGKEEGIKYKIFPSFRLKFGMEYSIPLLRELKTEAQKNEILIHLHGIHYHLPLIIADIFKNVPIVGQQHGDSTAIANYLRHKEGNKIRNKVLENYYLLNHIYEKKALKNIDKFFVLTKYEKQYLSRLVEENKIEIQTMGVDFKKYKPIEKELAREMLNLGTDQKIILYVGRFDSVKRVDLILDAFEKLKNKYNLLLILIGGTEDDIYYEKAKSTGAKVITRIPSEELITYYSAADVYVCYYSNNLWGGIGIAPVEAMACNLPVVSNTLEHFPGEERNQIGKSVTDEQDFVNCIESALTNSNAHQKLREYSMKYYNWTKIINNTIETYDELFKKYY